MRKAFDSNVPRRRPRLRRAAAVEGPAPAAPGTAQPLALVSPLAAPSPQAAPEASRRERLEKIKRRVAEIAAPAPRVEMEKIRHRVVRPSPPVGPLPADLARARQREEALRVELHVARGEAARAASEARGASERLAAAYADYLLQVAIRQRTRLAQAPDRDRPAALPGGVSRGAAGLEARQPEILGRIPKAVSAAGAGSNPSPQRPSPDPRPHFHVLSTAAAIGRGQPRRSVGDQGGGQAERLRHVDHRTLPSRAG